MVKPVTDRVVYVVLAHRLPEQLHRLVATLRADRDASIVVHYQDKAVAVPSDVQRLRSRQVAWGGSSIPELFLDGLRAATVVPGAEWVVFISGQDYPVRHPGEIRHDLLNSPYDVHLDLHRVRDGQPWPLWEPITRYGYRYTLAPMGFPPGWPRRKVWRAIQRGCEEVQRRAEGSTGDIPWHVRPPVVLRNVGARIALGVRVRQHPFASAPLWAGDAWFSIRVGAARELLKKLARSESYVRHMTRTLVPDEAFFHNVLANDLPHLSIGPSRRFRVFEPGDSHPRVWRAGDVGLLFATGADFARKFDGDVDEAILDLIDDRIRRT